MKTGNATFIVMVPDKVAEETAQKIDIDLITPLRLFAYRNYLFLRLRSNYNMSSPSIEIRIDQGSSPLRSAVSLFKLGNVPVQIQELASECKDGKRNLPALWNCETAYLGFELAEGRGKVGIEVTVRSGDAVSEKRVFSLPLPTHVSIDSCLVRYTEDRRALQTLLRSTEPIRISRFAVSGTEGRRLGPEERTVYPRMDTRYLTILDSPAGGASGTVKIVYRYMGKLEYPAELPATVAAAFLPLIRHVEGTDFPDVPHDRQRHELRGAVCLENKAGERDRHNVCAVGNTRAGAGRVLLDHCND